MTTTPPFTVVDRPPDTPPPDEPPPTSGPDTSNEGAPFTAGIPDSTPQAPYGYFTEGPKAGQARKRRPRGMGGSTVSGTAARSNEKLAADAAALLTQMNGLVGLSLAAFQMPLTSSAIGNANGTFEAMAREALINDPKLCRRILSGGMSSSTAGLIMAYVALGIAVLPPAQQELRARRQASRAPDEEGYPNE